MSKSKYLEELENEAIFILREVVAEFEKPVMLYSVGKDSSVMLHLAQKAFFPAKVPFPLLHIDTGYKFKEMYEFRDSFVESIGAELIVHRNEEAIANGAHPSKLGVAKCCGALKTQALLDALEFNKFDAAIGGAREMKKNLELKKEFFHLETPLGNGIQKHKDLNYGISIMALLMRANLLEYFHYQVGLKVIYGIT